MFSYIRSNPGYIVVIYQKGVQSLHLWKIIQFFYFVVGKVDNIILILTEYQHWKREIETYNAHIQG
jgi:hypothetical protein